jgi:hypothetical protein
MGIGLQPLGNGQRVVDVTLHAQGQRLQANEVQERVERRLAHPVIAQADDARTCDEGGWPGKVSNDHAVVSRLRLDESAVPPGGLPVELAAVDDSSADAQAVATDPFRRAVNVDVHPVVKSADQIRRAERVVQDDRDAVLVRHCSNTLQVRDLQLGVTDDLKVDGAGFVVDELLVLGWVVTFNKVSLNADVGQAVLEQGVRAAVESTAGDDLVTSVGQRQDGQRLGRLAAARGQRADASLQISQALLERRRWWGS